MDDGSERYETAAEATIFPKGNEPGPALVQYKTGSEAAIGDEVADDGRVKVADSGQTELP